MYRIVSLYLAKPDMYTVSQKRSVATYLRCVVIFIYGIIANLPLSLSVKGF